MTKVTSASQPVSQARKALRTAFVARLVRRMRRSGVLSAMFRVSFDADSAVTVFPPHRHASGVLAVLKPLCRSGVAAGGAGGGGPGLARTLKISRTAATGLLLAA